MQQKYFGPLSLLEAYLYFCKSRKLTCLCGNPLECITALSGHWSQLVWYRVLFALFSRYAFVNTYIEAVIEAGPQQDPQRKEL
jgi:hypothetical protein